MKNYLLLLLFIPLMAFAESAPKALIVTCDAPTTRVDGTPLSASEIRDYKFVLTKDSVVVSTANVPTCDWDLPEILPGGYVIAVSVFDTDGFESDQARVSFNVKGRPGKATNIVIVITIN